MWKSTAFALVFAVPVMTKGGCDGCDPSSGGNGGVGVDTGDTGGDSGTDTDTDVAGPCDSYAAQASEADLAATPRARPELEQLAIEMGGSFTANQATYDRLAADLAAIGTADPSLAGISYRSAWAPNQIIVGVDAATRAAIVAGTYTAWDCANDSYRLDDVQTGTDHAVLTFDGTYDIEALASEYSQFTGITYAEPNNRMGGGSTVCVVVDGSTWRWRLDEASGDCPAGCINHDYSYYTSASAGSVSFEGAWSNDMPPLTRPAWMELFASCDGGGEGE